MFTGSEKDLSKRLVDELSKLLPNDETKKVVLPRLKEDSDAIAKAFVEWVLANGKQGIKGKIIGNGSHQVPTGSFGIDMPAGIPHPQAPYTVSTQVQGDIDTATVEFV